MEKILLPTDFSENAKNAIRFGIKLFAYEESHHILLHSYEVPAASSSMLISVKDILKKESIIELEKLKAELEKEFYPYILDIEYVAEYGDVATSVNTVGEFAKADVVVMGTKGSSGLRELIMGSNTYSVIKKTERPVLAVPDKADFKTLDSILLITDYHEIKDASIFNLLNSLMLQYDSKLSIAHVNVEEHKDLDLAQCRGDMLNNVKTTGDPKFYELEGEDVIDSVRQFVESNKPDLMCVIAQKHQYFDSIFHKSVTKNLAMHPTTPLLILKDY